MSSQVSESEVTLRRLSNTPKTVRAVFEMLRHQPHAHYQAWGYGEPSEKSVRLLLGTDPVFGIYLNEQLVGLIGFTYKGRYFIQLYNGQVWLHYIVDQAHAGRGIVTVAIKKFFKILCDETDITRIYAGIYSNNPTSIHVVKKFGFVKREERAETQVFEKRLDCEDSSRIS